jgi:tRNA uridine 5-carbamoylmethylation protein Kti12
MKLLFLHGSPATGKLTVAKALLRMVPGRLMDNHAAIDFARTIFDFGAPGVLGAGP